jgi:hypothetical protein
LINPGHRLIFKFSIWKNDVTLMNDLRNVISALGAPVYRHPYEEEFIPEEIHENHDHNIDVIEELGDIKRQMYEYHNTSIESKNDVDDINNRLDHIEGVLNSIISKIDKYHEDDNIEEDDDKCCDDCDVISVDEIKAMVEDAIANKDIHQNITVDTSDNNKEEIPDSPMIDEKDENTETPDVDNKEEPSEDTSDNKEDNSEESSNKDDNTETTPEETEGETKDESKEDSNENDSDNANGIDE